MRVGNVHRDGVCARMRVCVCVHPVCAVIETKGRETEYASLREECNRTVEEVNLAAIKAQATMGPSFATASAAPY